MRIVVSVCALLTWVTPASAQSTYIAGSFMGEIARFGGLDLDDDDAGVASIIGEPSRNGETIGFDVRLGRAFSDWWGVEVAFARAGTIEQERAQRFSPARTSPSVPILPGTFPSFEFELRTSFQHTTIDTVAWVRQELGGPVHLSFLGGVSFTRMEDEQSLRITDPRLAIFLPFPQQLEATRYGVGPVVGAEAIVDFGEHAALTVGTRLHGGTGGWLIRPAVGVRWTF